MDFLTIIFGFFFVIHLIFLSITIFNFFTAPKIKNSFSPNIDQPKISILVPARNEEKNISNVINCLLKQSYKNYEIMILDDNSEDKTYDIIAEMAERERKVKIFTGESLPEGWLGKNWACYQLSKKADGKIFLFIDADVMLKPHGINYVFWLFSKNNLNLLSVFPSQKIESFGAKLIVPLMNWLLLTFLPLKMVFTSNKQIFNAANGQFIMIERDTYNLIGNHEKFKDQVVEDMEIARSVKSKKKRLMTCVGNNVISTNMYSSFSEAFNGFSKNFYKGFNTSKLSFLFIIFSLLILFLFPLLFAIGNSFYFLIVIVIIFQRLIVSIISKESLTLNTLLHPLQMIMMFLIGVSSLSGKKKFWKNRII